MVGFFRQDLDREDALVFFWPRQGRMLWDGRSSATGATGATRQGGGQVQCQGLPGALREAGRRGATPGASPSGEFGFGKDDTKDCLKTGYNTLVHRI